MESLPKTKEELVLQLASFQCEIHGARAGVSLNDGDIEFSEICCPEFSKRLNLVIDNYYHHLFTEGLDDEFS